MIWGIVEEHRQTPHQSDVLATIYAESLFGIVGMIPTSRREDLLQHHIGSL